MRNPEIATQKLEKLEGKLKNLQMLLTRPNTTAEQFKYVLNESEEIVDDLKMMVQRENNLNAR
jgi:hypothetical protein